MSEWTRGSSIHAGKETLAFHLAQCPSPHSPPKAASGQEQRGQSQKLSSSEKSLLRAVGRGLLEAAESKQPLAFLASSTEGPGVRSVPDTVGAPAGPPFLRSPRRRGQQARGSGSAQARDFGLNTVSRRPRQPRGGRHLNILVSVERI